MLEDLRLLLIDLHERRWRSGAAHRFALACLLLLLLIDSLLLGEILEQIGDYVIERRTAARADYRVERAQAFRYGREDVEEDLRLEHADERHVVGCQRL